LKDNSQSWLLQSDGSYQQALREEGEEIIQAQGLLLQELQG